MTFLAHAIFTFFSTAKLADDDNQQRHAIRQPEKYTKQKSDACELRSRLASSLLHHVTNPYLWNMRTAKALSVFSSSSSYYFFLVVRIGKWTKLRNWRRREFERELRKLSREIFLAKVEWKKDVKEFFCGHFEAQVGLLSKLLGV